jgi:hypothetical protein
MDTERKACRLLVGKSERKRPQRRPKSRLVYNIKMDLRDIGWGGVEWIDVVQDMDWCFALVNYEVDLWVP